MQNSQPQLNGWFGRMLRNVSQFIQNNLSFLPMANSVTGILDAGANAFGTGCKFWEGIPIQNENGYSVCGKISITADGTIPNVDEHKIASFFGLQFFPYLKKLMIKANAIVTNTVADRTAAINEVLTEMALLKHFAENNTLDIADETFFELESAIKETLKSIEDQIKVFYPGESSMVNVSLANTDISPIAYAKPTSLSVKLFGKGSVATTQVSDNSAAVTQVGTAVVNPVTNTVEQIGANSSSNGLLLKFSLGALFFYTVSRAFRK